MKAYVTPLLVLVLCTGNLLAQDSTISLSFTGLDGAAHRQLDSVYIRNLDRGGDTTLFWPDTVLVIDIPVDIAEMQPAEQKMPSKAYPNPFSARCHLQLFIPGNGETKISATDLLGRSLVLFSGQLEEGFHDFDFIPGEQGFYVLQVIRGSSIEGLKLVHTGGGQGGPRMEYRGKKQELPFTPIMKNSRSGFEFEAGDRLLFLGYSQGEESGTTSVPSASRLYEFQFASGDPCPGDPLVLYEGKSYPTVQIKSQCWLQKNLDVGEQIDGMAIQTDNGIVEKYCMAGDSSYCAIYGGLYQWDEMMAYTEVAGARGICPAGWHVPIDEEFRLLESAADNLYHYRDQEWDSSGFQGFDAGLRLKSDSLWDAGGNGTNALGFNALPGGTRGNAGFYLLLGRNAPYWSSSISEGEYVWYRVLVYNSDQVYRFSFDRYSGFAVRCLKDF